MAAMCLLLRLSFALVPRQYRKMSSERRNSQNRAFQATILIAVDSTPHVLADAFFGLEFHGVSVGHGRWRGYGLQRGWSVERRVRSLRKGCMLSVDCVQKSGSIAVGFRPEQRVLAHSMVVSPRLQP